MTPDEELRAAFQYDPETGLISRIPSSKRRSDAHDVMRRKDGKGYIGLDFRSRNLKGHRLAWFLYHGEWPPKGMHIDHINHDRADNRIANLRLSTPSQNSANKCLRSAGYRGVTFRHKTGKWAANIKVRQHCHHLGYFESAEAAAHAYDHAAINAFGEFASLNLSRGAYLTRSVVLAEKLRAACSMSDDFVCARHVLTALCDILEETGHAPSVQVLAERFKLNLGRRPESDAA